MMKTVKAANSGQTKRSHRAKGTRPIAGHLRHPPALSGNDPDHAAKPGANRAGKFWCSPVNPVSVAALPKQAAAQGPKQGQGSLAWRRTFCLQHITGRKVWIVP
jgi:hypothetical protein